MSFMDRLPSLDRVLHQRRPVTQKHQQPTKVDRVKAKLKADAKDDRELAAWAKKVKGRDGYKDRMTGQELKRGPEPHPLRAEAHHHEPRANHDVRYDVRNGICLSFEVHEQIEKHEITIVGRHFYRVKGAQYLNVSKKVRFVRSEILK